MVRLVRLPGMLYGEILRSPLPHARITRLDTSVAEAIRGVVAVYTQKEMPQTKFGAFDCLGEASGGFAYEQLKESAEELDVSGVNISVASLDDLIRMKRAAGRRKDLIEVENLAALRDVREGRAD